MPFGAVFASLLLGLVGVILPLSALGATSAPTALGRVALGVVCLNTAIGLLRRQAWARWGALLAAAVLLALHHLIVPPGGVTAKLAILFGAVLAVVLLALPATGKLPEGAVKPGNTLAVATVLGFIGLGLSFVWGTLAPPAGPRASPAPLQIAGLSPRVGWADFGDGLERAVSESKPVFVVFETSWCGYCRKMNRTTFKDPAVVEMLNGMVAIRVDAEDDTKVGEFSGRELASRYGVSGYPALLVLDAAGRVRARKSGFLESSAFLDWVGDATP
jgi:thiol:disulfide interchange protein